MTRRTRELDNPNHPYWTAPRNTWLDVGAPTTQPYPCRCADTGCRRTCPCRGRTHTIDLPARCCARRTAETARRKEA